MLCRGIDCLIADIGMPGIDGFELQRLMSETRPELPVILITGRHEIAELHAGKAQPVLPQAFRRASVPRRDWRRPSSRGEPT